MLTMEMIREAQERLRGVARVTPLNGAKTLGRNVYMKAEKLQLTGAFKLRGAYNKLCTLTELYLLHPAQAASTESASLLNSVYGISAR